jgi:hypothetical protein
MYLLVLILLSSLVGYYVILCWKFFYIATVTRVTHWQLPCYLKIILNWKPVERLQVSNFTAKEANNIHV